MVAGDEAERGHEMNVLPASIESFLAHLTACGRAYTASATRQALEQLVFWANQHSPSLDTLTATKADLFAFQSWLVTTYRSPSGKPLAKSTCSTRIDQVRSFYRWCCARGILAIDPSSELGVRRVRSRVVVRDHLTLQEATAMVQTQASVATRATVGTKSHALALRTLAAVCLGLATGRRAGGMTTLRVSDIDCVRRELRVEREKGSVGRVLPVAGWAVDVVALYLRDARPVLVRGDSTPWLFLNQAGTGPLCRISLRWIFRELVQLTISENPDLVDLPSRKLTWHSLRVSFARLLFSNGCDIRSVNELLLHTRLSTTALYTPVPIEELRQVFRVAHPRP